MSELPIACTLSPSQLPARRDDLLCGLFSQTEETQDLRNGYPYRFLAGLTNR